MCVCERRTRAIFARVSILKGLESSAVRRSRVRFSDLVRESLPSFTGRHGPFRAALPAGPGVQWLKCVFSPRHGRRLARLRPRSGRQAFRPGPAAPKRRQADTRPKTSTQTRPAGRVPPGLVHDAGARPAGEQQLVELVDTVFVGK